MTTINNQVITLSSTNKKQIDSIVTTLIDITKSLSSITNAASNNDQNNSQSNEIEAIVEKVQKLPIANFSEMVDEIIQDTAVTTEVKNDEINDDAVVDDTINHLIDIMNKIDRNLSKVCLLFQVSFILCGDHTVLSEYLVLVVALLCFVLIVFTRHDTK